MKELRRILFFIFIISLFLGLVGNVSYARNYEKSPPAQTGLENKRGKSVVATIMSDEESRQSRRCYYEGGLIPNRISKYEENKDSHVVRFGKFIVRLDEILITLTDVGYDTAPLSEHIEVIKIMIEEYITAYDAFIASLSTIEGIVCGDSVGEFQSSLRDAREQLKIAWQKRHEIRKYYAQTIRKDIQELRGGVDE